MIINENIGEIFPGVTVFDNVIDNCEDLIDSGLLNINGWNDSKIKNDGSDGFVNKEIRKTRMLPVPATYSNHIKWFEVSQIIWHYADQYAKYFEIQFSNMECVQLLHYSAGDGFYKPHVDSGPGINRIFSALLYLNDVDEGGETYFNKFEISISPKRGRLVIFPADYVYEHEARPPKSNDKFVLVTWFTPVL